MAKRIRSSFHRLPRRLAKAVREGRAKEFTGHAGHDETVPDPNDVNTFMRSKLDWNKADTEEGRAWLHVTRELIVLRQRFIVPLLKQRGTVEGNVLQTALGMVAVSWRFPSGTLSLALNIGKSRSPYRTCPEKRSLAGRRQSKTCRRTALLFALLMEKQRYDPFLYLPNSVSQRHDL